MEYKGKLYGRLGSRKYFPLEETSDDVDNLRKRMAVADEIIKSISIEPHMSGSTFSPRCGYKRWNELLKEYFEKS